MTTCLFIQALVGEGEAPASFIGAISLWLWFTILFANFSEALAEGRGKAQAEALRRTRKETLAKRIKGPVNNDRPTKFESLASTALRQGDLFLAEAGDIIAADGEVLVGIASVDESAITGESAPVIRKIGRRPQRGNWRHTSTFRLAGRTRERQPRAGLFRSHDHPGGRG